jgi:hypothetical protein
VSMPRPLPIPPLRPGGVYRARDLALVEQSDPPNDAPGRCALRRLGRGLYAHLRESRFGLVPPSDKDLLRSFLGDSAFVATRPSAWNALDLGATALHADTGIYNGAPRDGVARMEPTAEARASPLSRGYCALRDPPQVRQP